MVALTGTSATNKLVSSRQRPGRKLSTIFVTEKSIWQNENEKENWVKLSFDWICADLVQTNFYFALLDLIINVLF